MIEGLDPPGFKKQQRRDPKWLTSFADMMSLLLGMFVMLLSFADFDKTTFQKNAGSIQGAFDTKPPPPKIPDAVPSLIPEAGTPMRIDLHPPTEADPRDIQEVQREMDRQDIVERLKFVLAEELNRDMVEVLERDNVVVIRFRDRAAFPLGERDLKPAIEPALDNIANVLAQTPGRIRVEGHTDDIPIATDLFRSNWDLSAARAASVVQYLLKTGRIQSKRISAEGFADTRPLVANDTPDHRAMNRRVEISVELQTTKVP